MSPFSVCNDESFIKLLYALDPKFVCPDRNTLVNYLRDDFEWKYSDFKKILFKIESKISLTTDVWK